MPTSTKPRKRATRRSRLTAAQREAQRQANLSRMMSELGSLGTSGQDAQSGGPSSNYAGRIKARIKPNIVFTDVVNGNPRAEVEIRLLPDGTIVGSKLTQSSGNKAWDDAVLRAIDKTEILPKDTDGRVPPLIVLGFRPAD